jgi:hypothetical protein
VRRSERARADARARRPTHYGRGGSAERGPEASRHPSASGGTRGAVSVGRCQAGQLARGSPERSAHGTGGSSPDKTSRWSGFG